MGPSVFRLLLGWSFREFGRRGSIWTFVPFGFFSLLLRGFWGLELGVRLLRVLRSFLWIRWGCEMCRILWNSLGVSRQGEVWDCVEGEGSEWSEGEKSVGSFCISLASLSLCRCLEVSVTVKSSFRERGDSFDFSLWSSSSMFILSILERALRGGRLSRPQGSHNYLKTVTIQ